MGALRVVFIRSQLRVVIEMPAGELAGRDAAGNGVEQPEKAFGTLVRATEDRVVHHLVE